MAAGRSHLSISTLILCLCPLRIFKNKLGFGVGIRIAVVFKFFPQPAFQCFILFCNVRMFLQIVPKVEFVVIAGASGAGKSTILNILGGMDSASSGTIIVDGKRVSDYNARQLTTYRRYDIGFVFQFYNLRQGESPGECR
mgnify:CR=1 FL=1